MSKFDKMSRGEKSSHFLLASYYNSSMAACIWLFLYGFYTPISMSSCSTDLWDKSFRWKVHRYQLEHLTLSRPCGRRGIESAPLALYRKRLLLWRERNDEEKRERKKVQQYVKYVTLHGYYASAHLNLDLFCCSSSTIARLQANTTITWIVIFM